MLLNVFALGSIAGGYLKNMPKIQDKKVFWAKATKKTYLKSMDVNMANVCVSVLGEWKIILRRNNTKARF